MVLLGEIIVSTTPKRHVETASQRVQCACKCIPGRPATVSGAAFGTGAENQCFIFWGAVIDFTAFFAVKAACIDAVLGIIAAVDEQIIALQASICVIYNVRIEESMGLGVVIAALQIIQPSFVIVDIATRAKMGCEWRCLNMWKRFYFPGGDIPLREFGD